MNHGRINSKAGKGKGMARHPRWEGGRLAGMGSRRVGGRWEGEGHKVGGEGKVNGQKATSSGKGRHKAQE